MTFARKMREKKPMIGAMVTLRDPDVGELLSLCGYDCLLVDMEHTSLEVGDVKAMAQAVRGDCKIMARLPSHDPICIKRVLDAGIDTVVVPNVQSYEEAEAVLKAGRYPPLGTRGVGLARAQGYSTAFTEYLARANSEVAVWVQIEHVDALPQLEAILSMGIGGVLIGAYDLSASLGVIGEIQHPKVLHAIQQIRAACEKKGMPVSIFAATPDVAQAYVADGYDLVFVGLDTVWLSSAAKETLATVNMLPTSKG